jgi:hypothetical protein
VLLTDQTLLLPWLLHKTLLIYLSLSDYVKRFYQRITPSNDVEFMSDELDMTWKIMNELRRVYATCDSHRLLLADGRFRGLFVLM